MTVAMVPAPVTFATATDVVAYSCPVPAEFMRSVWKAEPSPPETFGT